MRRAAIAIACAIVLTVHGAIAQTPEVLEVVGASTDAYELAAWGDRVVVATSGGVALLREGRVERLLTARDGLPGLRFRTVSVVDAGVWVGGVDGAARLEIATDGNVRVAEHNDLPRVQRVVNWNGALYFATAGRGLLQWIPGAHAPVSIALGHSPAFMHVTDLMVDGDVLWAATAGGGVVGINARGTVAHRIGTRAGMPSDLVWHLARDNDRLIVATADGLAFIRIHRIDTTPAEIAASHQLDVPDVRSLAVTPRGLVVATWGGGASRFDARAHRFTRIEHAPQPRSILARTDGLYVSHDHGVTRIAPDGSTRAWLDTGLPSSDLTALTPAFGALWIATFDHGLARRDADGSVHGVDEAVTRWHIDPRVNDLARTRDEHGDERLWIATDRGLFVYDGRSFVPVIERGAPGPMHVTALHVDARGTLWLAGTDGLFHRDGTTWTHYAGDATLPMQPLGAVTTDARGIVWAGGLHGLFALDPATGTIAHHTVSRGELPVDWVTSITPTREGIAVGTYHGGVVWSDGTHFVIEREGGSMPSGWVNPHAMREINGAVWFGALDRGLVVGHRGHWHGLTLANGLPGNDVTAVLDAGDGTTWVATRAGLARIAAH